VDVTSTLATAAFLGVSSLVLLAFLLLNGGQSRVDSRIEELAEQGDTGDQDTMAQVTQSALPKLGKVFIPKSEADRTRLQTRLTHAGLYSRQALALFLGVKMLLTVGPMILGLAAGALGVMSVQLGLITGAFVGIIGMIGPSFWLDVRKRHRQSSFRRGIPDALDVIVICLEGGLSLAAALSRVAQELKHAHPLLAAELNIVQREVQLGRSEGEAMRQFADRCDLEEMRGLAAVIIQSERYGAGLVKALRTHAEVLRTRRMQYAEEMAQKAATKMLFPTVLFILPGIFIVVLGPAVIQILDMLGEISFLGDRP
jgi:tight adherence protein C